MGQASQEIGRINQEVPGQYQKYVDKQAYGHRRPQRPLSGCADTANHQPDKKRNNGRIRQIIPGALQEETGYIIKKVTQGCEYGNTGQHAALYVAADNRIDDTA